MGGHSKIDLPIKVECFVTKTNTILNLKSSWSKLFSARRSTGWVPGHSVWQHTTKMLNVIMLGVVFLFIVLLNAIVLSVIMMGAIILNVIMLNVIMLNVIMLKVIMLNVIILSVIILNVVILNVIMLSAVALILHMPRCQHFFDGHISKWNYFRGRFLFESATIFM